MSRRTRKEIQHRIEEALNHIDSAEATLWQWENNEYIPDDNGGFNAPTTIRVDLDAATDALRDAHDGSLLDTIIETLREEDGSDTGQAAALLEEMAEELTSDGALHLLAQLIIQSDAIADFLQEHPQLLNREEESE